MKHPNLLPLQGTVQDYAWGGYDYIPQLIGEDNPRRQPQAELWMGTHPRGVAMVLVNGRARRLDEWLATDPEGILGQRTARRFHGSLPFLFKILDVRKMLSIQAHPTKAAAVAGFARENQEGVPLAAANRNFKDDNHKPEIMVALTEFWLLHGFRPQEEIVQVLNEIPEFHALQGVFTQGGIRGLYRYIMELPQWQVDVLLNSLASRLEAALRSGTLDRSQADYWAAHAFRDYTRSGHYDRGIISIYLLNLVHLHPGQGIFQDANIPHAYLEGVNVELMANSDNVFRGGLTNKHVDVAELMQHLRFEPVMPQLLNGEARLPHETAYPAPVPDFDLSRIALASGDTFSSKQQKGPAIYILLSGMIDTEIGEMQAGDVFFSPDGAAVVLTGLEETVIFRAGVPE